MATFGEALERARQLLGAGHLAEAGAIYRQLVEAVPQAADAWHELGIVQLQAGDGKAAVESLRQAVALDSKNPAYHSNLGAAYRLLKQPGEALACFERALQLGPPTAELHNNLALCWKDAGQPDAALASFDRALALRPDYANGHFNRGNLLLELGRPREASNCYRQAIRLNPDDAGAHCKLGMTFYRWHEREEEEPAGGALDGLSRAETLKGAAACFRRATELNPDYADAFSNLGVVFKDQGNFDLAIACLQRALELKPDFADAHNNLGAVYEKQQKDKEAIDWFRRALQLQPALAEASISLAALLALAGDVAEARQCYSRALDCHPENDVWRLKLTTLCPTVFHSREEIEGYRAQLLDEIKAFSRRALRLDFKGGEAPDGAPSFNWQFHGCDERPLREAYAQIFRSSIANTARPRAKATGSPRGRRVGLVVTDRHEGLFLRSLGGVLRRIDPGLFELVLMGSDRSISRLGAAIGNPSLKLLPLPERFASAVDAVGRAQIDLLYYWEVGTDSINYFLPFRRLAPVQCTSWGIQVTSGIAALDYYLSSALVEPEDASSHYSEKLMLADTLLTYQSRASLGEGRKPREFFPVASDRHWYVCAQQLGKFHPDFDPILAGILRGDPQGVIVLVEDRRGRFTADQLRERFAAHMTDVAERIVFLPFQATTTDYLSLIAAADVLLDPLHFGGVNSTYDGFALNQPIVTLPSRYQRGRYTLGCYKKMEIVDCVAFDPRHYVEIAVALGTDRAFRGEVVEKIRRASPVLFEDIQAVREHERMFGALLEIARSDCPFDGT